MNNVAAEMARLKNEAEAARRKLEEEARRQAEEQVLAEEQSRAWEEAAQRAKLQAIVEVEQATQQTALMQAKATQTPVTRKPRKTLPIGKVSVALFILALILVVLLPYIYPLEEYIAPLEQRLSARLNQPVHIGGLSASSLPPTLQLQNVTVGNAQEVKIGSVILNFDPLSLLSEARVISNAEFQDVSIQGKLLDKQVASLETYGWRSAISGASSDFAACEDRHGRDSVADLERHRRLGCAREHSTVSRSIATTKSSALTCNTIRDAGN